MQEYTYSDIVKADQRFYANTVSSFIKFLEFLEPKNKKRSRIRRFFDFRERQRQKILKTLKEEFSSQSFQASFIYYVCYLLFKSFKINFLVKKILEFENYDVASFILYIALVRENLKKKKKKNATFMSNEQKSALIALMLNKGVDMLILADIRNLLIYSKLIPHKQQKELFYKYLMLFPHFLPASDLFRVYKLWPDLSPELHWQLDQKIIRALNKLKTTPVRVKYLGGMEVIDHTQNPSPFPGDDSDLN